MTIPSNEQSLEGLVERLRKRAEQDEAYAENNRAVADALQDQMDHFEARDGRHNTYAVRMAVDHRNGMKRDEQFAADLRQAVAIITALKDAS